MVFQHYFTMKKNLCLVRTLHAKISQTHHFLEQCIIIVLSDMSHHLSVSGLRPQLMCLLTQLDQYAECGRHALLWCHSFGILGLKFQRNVNSKMASLYSRGEIFYWNFTKKCVWNMVSWNFWVARNSEKSDLYYNIKWTISVNA